MLFRNRRVARAIACFLLLETIGNLVLPAMSWSMPGPSQPEFTNFQGPGATDMVNLSTGDLTYSLPVLDIPGPERSVSLPLTYQAGIQLEQEASWVGLGWTLNAGAINRNINGYPDDAMGEPVKNDFTKHIADGDEHWVIWGIWKQRNDSNTGTGGSVDLLGIASINWDRNGIGGDVIGVGYQPGQGLTLNPVRTALAIASVATAGGATAAQVATNVGINGLINTGVGTGISIGTSVLGIGRQGGVSGFNNEPTRQEYSDWAESWWRVFYNNRTTENAYGSLYFGKMSQRILTGAAQAPGGALEFDCSRTCATSGYSSYETAADIHQFSDMRAGDYYESSRRPVSIAHDYFQVMGDGVSGGIRPYRLDVGSVVYPKMGRNECTKHKKYMAVPFVDGYKVGFRYDGDLSNTYQYHENTPSPGNSAIGFEVNSSRNNVTISDPRLSTSTARIEPVRKGLAAAGAAVRQLVQGKHVVWYSNAEIAAMAGDPFQGYPNGFLNFERPVARTVASVTFKDGFRAGLPENGIGAFAITAEDGTTYHYSLPIYEYKTYSEGNEVRVTMGRAGQSIKLEGMPSANNSHGGYATTWLLTAVTSADFIDRNNSGTADEGDWGGWVKYSYGKYSSQFKWRQPYVGSTYSDQSNPIDFEGFTEGYKETYYLDAIATRSHTALFVKSMRQDGRGHFSTQNVSTSKLGINEQFPASSLRLDEIILLDNSTLKKLQTVDGIRTASDPTSTPALSNNTSNNATANACNCGDDLTRVLDGQDLNTDLRIKHYIEANATKRVRFNYTYELCPGTPNSFLYQFGNAASLPPMTVERASEQRTGKLTLKSLSFFGPSVNNTPTKIIPDFKFAYDNSAHSSLNVNPSYGKEKWDGFGMYHPAGAHNTTSHKPAASTYGAPWSLTTITTPLGGVTEISYERDQYASVSEFGNGGYTLTDQGVGQASGVLAGDGSVDLTKIYKPGDLLSHKGQVINNILISARSTGNDRDWNDESSCSSPYEGSTEILDVTPNSITIANPPEPGYLIYDCVPENDNWYTYSGGYDRYLGFTTTIPIPQNKVGGDIRVASISTRDENNTVYVTKYKYTNDGPAGANSTGVISKEPAFIKTAERPFERNFDYPATPVIYGKVTVLRGLFRNGDDQDIEQREVYSFFTPKSNMISVQMRPDWFGGFTMNGSGNKQVEYYNNQVTVQTGLIGRPKSVTVFNKQGQQELSTDFGYSNEIANADNIAKQGHYTEGVLTNELLDLTYYRINRTTKKYVPAVMVSSRSTRNGISIENNNLLYDFYTGQVLETSMKNALGRVVHSRSVPAYTLPAFASMGAKGDNAQNSHMLVQQAAAYTFLEIPGGDVYNPLNPFNPRTSRMLSAQVQTWNNNWTNYRGVSASGTPHDEPGPSKAIWRQANSYTWQSPLLNPDGTFQSFVGFNWGGVPDSRWLKTNETVRYDHYSHALETKDVNGLYAATKLGYNQSQAIASATNAKYRELAYSGAEDLVPNSNPTYFGGEVAVGGTQDGTRAHTGLYSDRLESGQQGLVYRAAVGPDLTADKTYRLSAWVHKSNAANGQLYAAVNGATVAQAGISSPQTRKAGEWYRLVLTLRVAAGQQVEFGCKNAGGAAVYFDDFRVCPLTAAMTSSVFDSRTNHLTYSLNNDNLFTRYQYDQAGKLVRVYQETFDRPGSETPPGGRLVKENAYNYARAASFTINTTVATNGSGSSVSPANSVSVLLGEETTFTFNQADCSYLLEPAYVVDGDGVSRTGTAALRDGTQVSLSGGQLRVSNIRGNHTVALAYRKETYPAAGTEINVNCEWNGSCRTGRELYYIADGCGGSTGPHYRTADFTCPPQPGCDQSLQSRMSAPKLVKPKRK